MRLLLAEDDQQLRQTLVRGLRDSAFVVDAVGDGTEAFSMALSQEYDALVLDVLMPGRNGVEVCRALRERGVHVPILLLTARDALDDKIEGLDAGADDYLTKPFAFTELLARVRALVRRRGELVDELLTCGDLTVDTRRRIVARAGRLIDLTAREYAFLAHLARHAERVVSRAELSAQVWDDSQDPSANLIDVYVSRIRRKLEAHGAAPILHTRRGLGVILSSSVPQSEEDA